MRCGVFKIFHSLNSNNGQLQELLIEDDYDYPQTYLFVEKVIQTLNDKYGLSLSLNSEEYQLFFAKKNGARNTSYPEIDLVNTNLQRAMKCYEKNTLLLQRRQTERNMEKQTNSLQTQQSQQQSAQQNKTPNLEIIEDNNNNNNSSVCSMEFSQEDSFCAKQKASRKILMNSSSSHSALTNVQSYNENNKSSFNRKQPSHTSNSSSLFSCFSLCSAFAD